MPFQPLNSKYIDIIQLKFEKICPACGNFFHCMQRSFYLPSNLLNPWSTCIFLPFSPISFQLIQIFLVLRCLELYTVIDV